MKTQTLALSLAVMFLATTAFADTRIAVLPVGGPGGAKAEAAIRKALGKRKDVEVVPAAATRTAIKKHGRKVPELAKALKADIVFVSLTTRAGKNMKLNIGVYDADGERLGGNGWALKKGEMKSVESDLWAELSPSIRKGSKKDAPAEKEEEETEVAEKPSKKEEKDAPKKEAADDAFGDDKKVAKKDEPRKDEAADEEEAEPDPKKKVAAKDEESEASKKKDEESEAAKKKKLAAAAREEEEDRSRRSSADEDVRSSDEANEVTRSGPRGPKEDWDYGDLDAEVGMHAFTRSFSYNQPLQGALASYRLSSGPAIAGGVEWYAGKLAGDGFARNIGVAVQAESAFGIGSEAADGSRVGTSAYAFDLGPRVRIPVSGHKLSVGAGYGQRVFGVAETDDPVLSLVPDVAYKFLSLRAGGRYNLSDALSVNLNLAYLNLMGTGELSSERFFPRLSGAGVEANAYVGYEVAPKWEVRVGVDLTRFFFALKPEPGDANVAGGAVDQFFAGTARIAYRL